MKIYYIFLVIFFCAISLYAQDITKTKDGRYIIKAKTYTAETGTPNGDYLSGIKINGSEFEDQIQDITRGNYILNSKGECLKAKVLSQSGNTITASTDITDILYTFFPDKIEISVQNPKEKGSLFFVLNQKINLVHNEKGKYQKDNILEKSEGKWTFIRERAGLEISGNCTCFGPQLSCYAAECSFKTGEKKKIILTPICNLPEKDLMESVACPKRDIMLYTPQNYQVFQRESKEAGHISINGRVSSAVKNLSYRITGNDLHNQPLDTDWQTIKTDKYHSFNLKPELKAGGWYKLQIKYNIDGKDFIKTVEKIGIGEIIVGAGQSNSTCCGQYRIKTETKMVSNTDGVRWRLADDPQISPHDGMDLGSFWPALGDILYKKFRVPIAVVPLGWGGTKIAQWHPTAEPLYGSTVRTNISLYDYFIDQISDFGVRGFRCVLWHQGESDIDTPGYKYYNDVCDMIWASKRDAGWDVPWFIAKASYIPKKTWGGVEHYGFNEKTINAQQKLIDDGIGFEGPNTDTLLGDYRDNNGGVHFSPKGLKKHAEMWAEFIIPYIEEQIK